MGWTPFETTPLLTFPFGRAGPDRRVTFGELESGDLAVDRLAGDEGGCPFRDTGLS